MEEIVFKDDKIIILKKDDDYFIQSFNKGLSLEAFNDLMLQFPNIKITQFLTVKKVLNDAPSGPELFAAGKERIDVEILDNGLEARMTLHVSPEELSQENRRNLILEITEALKRSGVNYGIAFDAFKGELPANKPIVIARGVPPVHGKDAVLTLYQIEEPKPEIVDSGKVNHYNLNLIHQIQAGEWLGERIDPIPGAAGKSVTGQNIPQREGVLLPLPYDRESVEMVREEGKDVLYALKPGAVHYVGDQIAVYDVMEINGDVDFNTGNLDFTGYVTIKGSVEENFSVRAKKDIEISGEYGIGGVDTIESLEGNIYIRGGIAGKGKAKILCKKNLYVKYLSDVEVVCEGSVYVGFYVRNAHIKAKQVIVDSPRGQIAGGITDADIRIECADIGNAMEIRTGIIIRGFSRSALQSRMDDIVQLLLEKKDQLVKLKLLAKGPEEEENKKKNTALIKKTQQALRTVQEDIRTLESERLSILNFMRTPGEGAVVVRRRIYPRVKLTLQNINQEIMEPSMATTYVAIGGSIQML